MRDYIKRVLADNDGNPSSMRLIFVIFGLLFSFCFCTVWVIVSIHSWSMSDVPMGVAGILGILLAGKTAQKVAEVWGENKPPTP